MDDDKILSQKPGFLDIVNAATDCYIPLLSFPEKWVSNLDYSESDRRGILNCKSLSKATTAKSPPNLLKWDFKKKVIL